MESQPRCPPCNNCWGTIYLAARIAQPVQWPGYVLDDLGLNSWHRQGILQTGSQGDPISTGGHFPSSQSEKLTTRPHPLHFQLQLHSVSYKRNDCVLVISGRTLQEKSEVPGERSTAILSTTNATWTGLALNSLLCSHRMGTNHMIQCTISVIQHLFNISLIYCQEGPSWIQHKA